MSEECHANKKRRLDVTTVRVSSSSSPTSADKNGAMSILESLLQKYNKDHGLHNSSTNEVELQGQPPGPEEAVEDNHDRVLPEDFPENFVAKAEAVFQVFVDGFEDPMGVEFAHQIFPDQQIIGYDGLSIKCFYTKKWRMFVKIGFEAKLDKVEPHWPADLLDTDLVGALEKSVVVPLTNQDGNFTTDYDVFEQWLAEDGTQDEEFELTPKEDFEMREIVKDVGEGFRMFVCKGLHETENSRALFHRLQALSGFFIETSEQTDVTDPRWTHLYLVTKGATIVGFTTTFEFVNPTRKDAPRIIRICQSFVLPCCQRKGLARGMLEYIYNEAAKDDTVYQVTVESPCESFERLRDVVETKLCLDHHVFPVGDTFPIYETDLGSGIVPTEMVESIQRTVKIIPKQIQRVYEILRLKNLEDSGKCTPETMRRFRLDVKRRMVVQNVEKIIERPPEELKENLGLLYDDLYAQYEKIMAKF